MAPASKLTVLSIAFSLAGCGAVFNYERKLERDFTGSPSDVPDIVWRCSARHSGTEVPPSFLNGMFDLPLSLVSDDRNYCSILFQRWDRQIEDARMRDIGYLKSKLKRRRLHERLFALNCLGGLGPREQHPYKTMVNYKKQGSNSSVAILNESQRWALGGIRLEDLLNELERVALTRREQFQWSLDVLRGLAEYDKKAAKIYCRLLLNTEFDYDGLGVHYLIPGAVPRGRYSKWILTELLKAKSPKIRCDALLWLARLDFNRSKPALVTILSDNDLDLNRRLRVVEAFVPGTVDFSIVRRTLKEAIRSTSPPKHRRALQVVSKWGVKAQGMRPFILAQFRFNDEAAAVEAVCTIASLEVQDEIHFRALLMGLKISFLSVWCEQVLEKIDQGSWGQDWVAKSRAFLKSEFRREPGLTPNWYRDRRRKK